MNIIESIENGNFKMEDLKNIDNFYTWEQARPVLIEVGKKARTLSNNHDSFFLKKMMQEVEECYYNALHADCGYSLHVAVSSAFGWLIKMVEFSSNF